MDMNQNLNRIMPRGNPQDYKTYGLTMPKETHTRVASCKEVECEAYLKGWVTKCDPSLHAAQIVYIRNTSGRRFSVHEVGGIVHFTFGPGQKCFREHRVQLEREPVCYVKGGDWRGNPMGLPTVVRKPAEWVEDFALHQQKLSEQQKRGTA
jgi:hypothetical protein